MKKITILITFILICNIANSQDVSVFSSGYTALEGIAINSNNEVYISEHDSGKVFKLDSNGDETLITTAGGYANDMVFDVNDNLYITEPFTNKISVVDNITGVKSEYVSTLTMGKSPYGIVFYNGFIYYSSESTGKVVKVNANLTGTDYAIGFFNPEGIAFDSNGNLYVANRNERNLVKVTPSGVKTTLAVGIENIRGVAVSSTNDVYFTMEKPFPLQNKIMKYNAVSGAITDFVTTFLNKPRSIAIDDIGNMYVTNMGDGTVTKISDPTLSINAYSALSKLHIYPNPSSKTLNVSAGNSTYKITIYNLSGQKLLETESSNIDVENLNTGVYLVRIEDENKNFVIKKFVKQ